MEIQFNFLVRSFVRLIEHNHLIYRELYRDLFDIYITAGKKISQRYPYTRLQRHASDQEAGGGIGRGGRGVGSNMDNNKAGRSMLADYNVSSKDDIFKDGTSAMSSQLQDNSEMKNDDSNDKANGKDAKVDADKTSNSKFDEIRHTGKLKPFDATRLPGSFGYVPDYTRRGTIGVLVKTAFGRAALPEDKIAGSTKTAPSSPSPSRNITKSPANGSIPRYAEKTTASAIKAQASNSARNKSTSSNFSKYGYINRESNIYYSSDEENNSNLEARNAKNKSKTHDSTSE